MTSTTSRSGLARFLDYVVLPSAISEFEARYLRRMNRLGLAFFVLHVPVMVVIGWINGTGPLLGLALALAVVSGPAIAYPTLTNPRSVSVVYGIAAMCMGGVLVHLGQGPVQIEMHFYFFALLAMLAVFGNPAVILAAAATVTLHHLALWFILPKSVFNYAAPVWVVAIHGAFVVLESVAACFIARSFFDNVIGLERIVQARTAELDARNRDMRLVLDHVAQGLATIDRRGMASAETSRTLDTWFGTPADGETLFDVLARQDADFAERSGLAWDEVVAGIMPLALTLDQMPAELDSAGRHYRIAYLPIGEGEDPEKFLVVVTDVTSEVARARAEQDQRDAMRLFERMFSDRTAVNDFFEEGSALVRLITEGDVDTVTLRRVLHTLKGNSAIFGLQSLSSLCHGLETFVEEEGTLPPSEVARLTEQWARLSRQVERLVGARRQSIEIDRDQQAALEDLVQRGAPRETILREVRALRLEPVERRLELFGEQARRIAGRLDKEVDVKVRANDLRIDPGHWGGFWSAFIHAIRNAIDHGVEPSSERRGAGKPEKSAISLESRVQDDRFVVEVSDDGRGIDWERIVSKARERGLPTGTADDRLGALFADGVSTATRVTDLSGRGIGMGALREATEALRGRVEIESRRGDGTVLRMVFPRDEMAPERAAASTAAE